VAAEVVVIKYQVVILHVKDVTGTRIAYRQKDTLGIGSRTIDMCRKTEAAKRSARSPRWNTRLSRVKGQCGTAQRRRKKAPQGLHAAAIQR